MNRNKSFLITLISLMTFASVCMGGQVVDKIVAFVDNTPITQSDLKEAIKNANLDIKGQVTPVKKRRTPEEVLEALIDQKVLEAELENHQINITEADVEQALKNMATQNHTDMQGFRAIIAQHGVSYEKYKENLKNDLKKNEFIKKVIYPKIRISDHDLEDYFNQHKNDFTTYEKIRFSEIVLAPDSAPPGKNLNDFANELVSSLRKGGDFALSARIYSHGPFADDGGDSGVIETSQMRPDLLNILLQLKPNTISDPIPVENVGIIILKVVQKSDPKNRTFNDVRESLRQQFGEQKVREELERFTMEAKAHHYIEIRPDNSKT